jgi:two-component system, chemotaxis family, chemotaxis protein CheY
LPEPRILLVDGHPDALIEYARTLEADGYDTVRTAKGEGLAEALANPPDLIIVDTEMPRDEAYRLVCDLSEAAETHDVPIIVITQDAFNFNHEQYRAAGADGYLAKPCSPPALRAMVLQCLGDAE